ncbi:hypothetical protein MFIFM68171_10166 [Madurella fahalii]|uniref:VOC domain-containing protein n=1 Tax=Madurella fahalii TaxID=1157608 RepID=A0ABQ0GQE0_9PEZI
MADWKPPGFGAPVWLGISANDVSRAEKFYAAVFNWSFHDPPANQSDGPKTRLFSFTSAGVALHGGIQHKPETSNTGTPAAGHGGVCIYWLVEDLAETAKVIEHAGGKMIGSMEPIKEGESGFYRYFEDTEGNVGAVHQLVGM